MILGVSMRVIWVRLYFFFFLWPHLGHMEVPRLGVEFEVQLRPKPQPQQRQIQAANAGSLIH